MTIQKRLLLVSGLMFLCFFTLSCGLIAGDISNSTANVTHKVALSSALNLSYSVSPDGLLLKNSNSSLVHLNKSQFSNGLRSVEWSDSLNGFKLGEWTNYLISVPQAISSQGYGSVNIDPVSGFLVISSGTSSREIRIIDTKKNDDPLDDELIAVYTSATIPELSTSWVYTVAFDGINNLLYVGIYNVGVYVINTNGTASTVDDVVLGKYCKLSGQLSSDRPYSIAIDSSNDLLYVSTYYESAPYTTGGVQVIDRMGTTAIADDVSLRLYNYSTIANFSGNTGARISLVPSENQVLVSSVSAGTFQSIDTKGTRDPSDDTVLYKYDGISHPALINHHGSFQNSYDPSAGLLLVNSINWGDRNKDGTYVVNTNKTSTGADDTIVGFLKNSELLGVPYDYAGFEYDTTDRNLMVFGYSGLVKYTFNSISNLALNTAQTLIPELSAYSYGPEYRYDQSHKALYLQGPYGFFVYTPGKLAPSGSLISDPISLSGGGYSESSLTGNSTDFLTIQYRTANASAAFKDDLSAGNGADWDDFYAWGAPANTVSFSGGIAKLTDFTDATWGSHWFKLPSSFPAGSVVKVRARYNTASTTAGLYMFENDWWQDFYSTKTNEWVEFSFGSSKIIEDIGFYWECSGGSCATSDSIEIDEILVVGPDGMWSSWSTAVAPGATINIDHSLAAYLQYKVNFTSYDRLTSPLLNQITLKGSYETIAEDIFDLNLNSEKPVKLVANTETPVGTTVEINYSVDGGATWVPTTFSNGEFNFPIETERLSSIKIRVKMTTADVRYSPKLRSLSLICQ